MRHHKCVKNYLQVVLHMGRHQDIVNMGKHQDIVNRSPQPHIAKLCSFLPCILAQTERTYLVGVEPQVSEQKVNSVVRAVTAQTRKILA